MENELSLLGALGEEDRRAVVEAIRAALFVAPCSFRVAEVNVPVDPGSRSAMRRVQVPAPVSPHQPSRASGRF